MFDQRRAVTVADFLWTDRTEGPFVSWRVPPRFGITGGVEAAQTGGGELSAVRGKLELELRTDNESRSLSVLPPTAAPLVAKQRAAKLFPPLPVLPAAQPQVPAPANGLASSSERTLVVFHVRL